MNVSAISGRGEARAGGAGTLYAAHPGVELVLRDEFRQDDEAVMLERGYLLGDQHTGARRGAMRNAEPPQGGGTELSPVSAPGAHRLYASGWCRFLESG